MRDPRRQPGLERRDLLLDPLDDVDGADPVARDHDAPDRLFRAFDQGTGPEGIADLHLGDLADEDRHAVLGADDDLLDIAQALDEPQAADDRPGAARLDDIAADVAVAPHHRVDDGGERDAEGAQAVRVDVDLILPDDAPDARHLGDAWHGVELIADEPVLERPQVPERVALPLDRVPEDVADAGGVRAERRHDARRQRLRDQVQPLQHPRAGEVEVDRVLEDDVDHREAKGRGRPHHAHAGQPLEADRERVGDLVLDLLRRAARPVGEDDHLVVRQIGDGVDRDGQQRPVPPARDQQKARDDEKPIAQCGINEPVDHAGVPSAPRDARACRDAARTGTPAGPWDGSVPEGRTAQSQAR